MNVIARRLAWAEGKTLEALDQAERDRYLELAAVVEDLPELHHGCYSEYAVEGAEEQGRREGSAEAYKRVLDGIAKMRASGRGRWSDGTLYDVEKRVLALVNGEQEASAA